MTRAHEHQVAERRLSPSGPPDHVVPIAPGRRPVAMVDHTAAIASHERATSGRGDPLMRVAGLALQLRSSEQPADRWVAVMALCGLDWNRPVAFKLRRRRAGKPS